MQKTDLIGDPVILRADGTPLYNFATVVDDIAHEDHARRPGAGAPVEHLHAGAHLRGPRRAAAEFGHIPVVNEPAPKPGAKYPPGVKPPNKNKKLSKRDMAKFVDRRRSGTSSTPIGWTDEQIDARDDLNPATVAFYRELGYLPEGLINYLGRLGWSLDDKTEFMTLDRDDRELLPRARQRLAGQLRSGQALLAGRRVHEAAADRARRSPGCDPVPASGEAGRPSRSMPATRDTVAPRRRGDAAIASSCSATSSCTPRRSLKRDPEYDAEAVESVLKKPGVADLLRGVADALRELRAVRRGDDGEGAARVRRRRAGSSPARSNQPLRVA